MSLSSGFLFIRTGKTRLFFGGKKHTIFYIHTHSFDLLPLPQQQPPPSDHQAPCQAQHPQQRQDDLHKRPHGAVRPAEDGSAAAGEGGIDKVERQAGAEMIDGDLDSGGEGVLVEAVLGPGAGVADGAGVLDAGEAALGADGGGGVEGVVVGPGAVGELGGGRVDGVEGDEDGTVRGVGDVLEYVHVVG